METRRERSRIQPRPRLARLRATAASLALREGRGGIARTPLGRCRLSNFYSFFPTERSAALLSRLVAHTKKTQSLQSLGGHPICRREDAKCRSSHAVLLTRAAAPLQTFHADSRFPDARRGAKWTPRRDSRRSDTHHARRFGPGSGAPAQYRTRAASSRPRPPSFLTRRTLRGGKGSPGWRCGGTEGRSRDAGGGCTDFASAGRDLIWQRASRRTGA